VIGNAYRAVIHTFAYAAALILGAVAVLVTLDVVMRNTGLGTIAWVVEVSEYSLPLATFLIAPWLLHRNEHVRLDVVLVLLPPRRARAMQRCADAVGIVICAVFVWYGVKLVFDSARLGSMVVKTLTIPEWWQYALVPVCFLLLAIEFLRRLLARSENPLQVPTA
jgi:TRAP-type C4-dicarboxylate transport system permease small subunit